MCPTDTQDWLRTQLTALQHTLVEIGPDVAGYAAAVDQLRHRLKEGRFRLAVLGQFKRGKSTLLNALLHEPLLPMGILPLTAIPTTIKYGPARRVRITFRGDTVEDVEGSLEEVQQVLKQYVTEENNPVNKLGVDHVEVEHPAEILASGVEIIDTPGIGSTMLHNTRTARQTLPVCDGALFVLSPDPPITEAEVSFLRAVREAATRIMFVLAKDDILTPSDRGELLTFLRNTLRDEAGFSGQEPILPVSARHALKAYATGVAPFSSSCSVAELESYLTKFLLTDKQVALQEAIRVKAARVVSEVLFSVDFQRKIIQLPREDLERRCERFDAHLAKIKRKQMYFRDRLGGDRQRMLEDLDRQTAALVDPAKSVLSARAEGVLVKAGSAVSDSAIRRKIHDVLSQEVDHVFQRAAKEIAAAMVHQFQTLQETYCREMEHLIDRVRQTAADLFEVLCLEGVAVDRLETIREPRVISQRLVTSFIEEAALWLTRFLPRRWRVKRFEQQLRDTIEYLIARNVEELRWAARQNVEGTFLSFQAQMEPELETVITSIRTAISSALDRQARREAVSLPELKRIEGFRCRLEELRSQFSLSGRPTSYDSPV